MRGISGLVFGLGLGVLLTGGQAKAQEAAKPAVQIVIGADGSVRVIDAKTGKEIARVVAEKQADSSQKQQAQKQLEKARKELERVLRVQQEAQPVPPALPLKKKDPIERPPVRVQIVQDGPPRIPGQPVLPPAGASVGGSLEKKIDLILKQLDELRRDVNQLKSKLDGKQPNRLQLHWEVVPNPAKDGKDKKKPEPPRILIAPIGKDKIELRPLPDKGDSKLEKEVIEGLNDLLRKLEGESKDKRKKAAGEKSNKERPVDRNVELERRLERILQEAEELRREIGKTKPATK
jgi:hypothetical protein